MTGRKWTAEEKLAIVLEGIKGAKPVTEICREHCLAQTQYYQWRDRFLEGGKRALTNGLPATEEALTREITKLQRLQPLSCRLRASTTPVRSCLPA